MDIYIITGPPYSGKGTQSEILSKTFKLKHISTGDRCRLEKQKETNIGLTLTVYEKRGDLVPDSVMESLLNQLLDENLEEEAILLDGYPRTIAQVDTLIKLAADKELHLKKVLNIEVPEAELLKRALERASTSDREDDRNPATHIKRIKIFKSDTLPAITYMKEKIVTDTFDGLGSINETAALISEAFEK